MQQALDPTAYVFDGLWTDQTKGSATGLTLTLCPTSSNLLIATLGIFVTMAGSQFWTILRFVLHQIRATPQSKTTSMLHQHQQIVLRNAATDLTAVRLFVVLSWAWRTRARRPFRSAILIVLLALGHSVLFMLAGTFSSTLASAGEGVLTRSPFCGTFRQDYLKTAGDGFNLTSTESFAMSIEYIAKQNSDVQLSQQYARECYNVSQSNTTSSCGTFQQPRLNWTTQTNGSCPFSPRSCHQDVSVLVLDTGFINSYTQLGINAKKGDQLWYRRVTNCTALNDTDYTSNWTTSAIGTGPQTVDVASANYGHSLLYDNTNATYEYTNFASSYTEFQGATTVPYQVDVQTAVPAGLEGFSGSFVPIPELSQKYADLNLVFLSYTGSYASPPVTDPWFSARQPQYHNRSFANTTWGRDRPISTLGCTEQHQICVASGLCTPLLSSGQVIPYITLAYNITPYQNVTLERLVNAATASNLNQVVQTLAVGSTPLLAVDLTASETTVLSLSLPSYQWQLEVNYWHSVAMAHLQRIFVEYGTGQIAAQTQYLALASTDSERWLCNNMLVRGTNMQSFNVFALSLILAFGLIVVVLSLTIENLAACLQRRLQTGQSRMEMWNENDMLNLQLWAPAARPKPRLTLVSEKIPSKERHGPEALPKPGEVGRLGRITPQMTRATRKQSPSVSVIDPTPSPNIGRIMQAVSLASYREGFRAGHGGSWL